MPISPCHRRNCRDQIWIDSEAFKPPCMALPMAGSQRVAQTILDTITSKNNLTYILCLDRTKIGFIEHSETDDSIAEEVFDAFYAKAGRR